jgi:hypothetical protein
MDKEGFFPGGHSEVSNLQPGVPTWWSYPFAIQTGFFFHEIRQMIHQHRND